MAGFNGSGTFVRTYNWVNDKTNGINITASRFDTEDNGFATGLSTVICKDGQSTTTAIIPFASGISAAAGSVSAMMLGKIGELTTGIYSSATAKMDVAVAGVRVGGFASTGLDNTVIGAGTPLAGTFTTIAFAKGANIASAATTNLATATGNYVSITGTVTITAFGTANAGVIRYLNFAGILTLTHNATSLILPGGANITTAAGDTATAISEGSGNWRVLQYQQAANSPAGGFTASSVATLTNKTFNTAGSGNVFQINGVGITAVTGTGSVVLAAAPALTGVPTAPTAAGGTNTTQIATTAFVAAALGLKVTAGSALTVDPFAHSNATQAHGLGASPTFLDIKFVCKSADLGYSAGDEYRAPYGGNSTNAAYAVWSDGTNCGFGGAAAPSFTQKTGNASGQITEANWKIVITPYKLA